MDSLLIEHARQHVWCAPTQDRQLVFIPARLTSRRGRKRHTAIEWNTLFLPDQTSVFHVFQLGQLSPAFINLVERDQQWYSLQYAMNTQKDLWVECYDDIGRQIPRSNVFMRRTRGRNMVMAVRHDQVFHDLGDRRIYIRFYSNAFFASTRSHGYETQVRVESRQVTKRSVIGDMNNLVSGLADAPGAVLCYHNGWLVDQFRVQHIAIGDWIEYVHDTSVKDVIDWPVRDLPFFTSTLDQSIKHLLLRGDNLGDTIDYRDDIDVYVYSRENGRLNGLYYHKHRDSALRMVTHRDYSLPTQALADWTNRVDQWDDSQDLTIRLYIRQAGFARALVDEHHRIKDLYRLSSKRIEQAMIGAQANLNVWQVASLESSAYTRLMGLKAHEITIEDVKNTYGYNALSQIIGQSTYIPFERNGRTIIEPAYGLAQRSTMFEYNRQGKLLGYYHHSHNPTYVLRNPILAGYVEAILGHGSGETDTVMGDNVTDLHAPYAFRAYWCNTSGGEPVFDWHEAVLDENYVFIDDSTIAWLGDTDQRYTAIRHVPDFLIRDYVTQIETGLLAIQIDSVDVRDGERVLAPLQLPWGKLDVFLNDHALIEGLDYIVDWPQIVIFNKQFLNQHDQHVLIRAYAHPQSDLSRYPVAEHGFVQHGLLSVNDRFDVRDDKNMRYVMGGRLVSYDDLVFEEDRASVRVDAAEGTPYAIDEVIVPMEQISNTRTEAFRERSIAVDQAVSNYLTRYYPRPTFDDPVVIQSLYAVYSPFTTRIHDLLQDGMFTREQLKGRYSNFDLEQWVEDYTWLLAYDPIVHGFNADFVSVHPHPYAIVTELDFYQYRFLERVIEHYLDGQVDLSHHVRLPPNWV